MYKYFNLISWIKNELLSQCRYNGFPSIPLKKRRKWQTDLVTLLVYIRASTSMGANFPSILHKKPIFSILHIQFYKTPTSIYLFFFLQFFIILSLTAPLFHRPNNTNDHSTPSLHHHPPNQHHQGKSTHSIRETNTPKLTPIRNPVHRRSGLIISSIQN